LESSFAENEKLEQRNEINRFGLLLLGSGENQIQFSSSEF
jgi:hypothetical protein